MERKLAAILAADVVGYSRLMEIDEADTLAALKAHREGLIDLKIAEHHGRTIKLMGDGSLVEFASVVDAVACALAIQKGMAGRNEDVPEDRRIEFRIGVHLGDVMVEGDDLYGDGVNVAARLEGLAEPGGVCISQQAFDQVETKLDLAYEDLGEQQVKNLARPVRTYRILLDGEAPPGVQRPKTRGLSATQIIGSAAFVVLVVAGLALAWWQPWQPDVEPASIERMAFPLPDKPSIAVLPFANMSDDPQQEYFADGMTEDLITDLSKISGLFVIARNSTFIYKGKTVTIRQVAEELGVRYVLEGSVRRADGKLRINAQLIDATTGGHVWAERYDSSLTDVFALQDKVTQNIVTALAVKLTAVEREQQARKETDSPEAYDAFLRGRAHYLLYTPEDFAKSVPYFEEAIQLDPNYGRAHAALATVYWESRSYEWVKSLGISYTEAGEKARRHLEEALKDPTPLTHRVAARMLSHQDRWDEAIAEAERAIALDANDPDGYVAMSGVLVKVGRPAEGLKFIETAMRLDPQSDYLWRLGTAQFHLERYDEAAATMLRATKRSPGDVWNFLLLAAAYGQLGREQEAKSAIETFNKMRAEVGQHLLSLADIGGWRFKYSAERERLREGLRKAGLPDIKPASRENLAFPLPERPSIAVLAFDNLSGDPAQDYFADGITASVITELSRFRNLFVIARNSTFTYKGKPVKVQQVAEDLGVQYVLEGSVQRSKDRVRINVQLIDAITGWHLWAERYDRELNDLFAVQDEVTRQIVATLATQEGRLAKAWQERTARKGTVSLKAYDLDLRGVEAQGGWTKEAFARAEELFEKAIAADPEYARPYANLAMNLVWQVYSKFAPEEALGRAVDLAKEAIARDDAEAWGHWALGAAYLKLGAHEQAVAEYERALEINPNDADVLAETSFALAWVGRAEEGIENVTAAMRLNPRHPDWYLWGLGVAYYDARRYADAVATLESRKQPNLKSNLYLAAAYAQQGRQEQAQATVQKILDENPESSIERYGRAQPYKNETDLSHYIDGLRKAGIPE